LRLRAQIFEIYPQDWLIAFNPGHPQYAKHHQEHEQAYAEAAKVVGGK
jgi:hypothetical protein